MVIDEKLSREALMQVLKSDDIVEFRRYFETARGLDGLLEFLNRNVDSSYKESGAEINNSGMPKNTVMWSLFRNKSYNCFNILAEYADNILDFEVALRSIKCLKKFADGHSNVYHTMFFIDLIADRKSSDEIVPWFQGSKEYWYRFFIRSNPSKEDLYVSKLRSGVIKTLHTTNNQNSEILIALHKVGIIDLEDVRYIAGIMKYYGETRGIDPLAKHTISSVENEELLRKYKTEGKMNTLAAL